MFADIDHAHGDVVKDLNAWSEWVIKETGAAGFRFDAVKVRRRAPPAAGGPLLARCSVTHTDTPSTSITILLRNLSSMCANFQESRSSASAKCVSPR